MVNQVGDWHYVCEHDWQFLRAEFIHTTSCCRKETFYCRHDPSHRAVFVDGVPYDSWVNPHLPEHVMDILRGN